VIDHGKKIAEGSVRELKTMTGSSVLRVSLVDSHQMEMAANILATSLNNTVSRNAEGGALSARADSTEAANKAVTQLMESGIELDSFAMESASLEEVFFALTGHGITNGETDNETNNKSSDEIKNEIKDQKINNET